MGKEPPKTPPDSAVIHKIWEYLSTRTATRRGVATERRGGGDAGGGQYTRGRSGAGGRTARMAARRGRRADADGGTAGRAERRGRRSGVGGGETRRRRDADGGGTRTAVRRGRRETRTAARRGRRNDADDGMTQ